MNKKKYSLHIVECLNTFAASQLRRTILL